MLIKDKGSWRENKAYIILFLNEKAKGTKYERYERHNIIFNVLKVKIRYCLLEVTEVVLELKIFKIRDTFRATYDWYYLVLNYF